MSFLSLDNESTTKWVELSIREHYDFVRPLFSRFDCTNIEEIASFFNGISVRIIDKFWFYLNTKCRVENLLKKLFEILKMRISIGIKYVRKAANFRKYLVVCRGMKTKFSTRIGLSSLCSSAERDNLINFILVSTSHTAKRILERLGIQTSSSFVKIW